MAGDKATDGHLLIEPGWMMLRVLGPVYRNEG